MGLGFLSRGEKAVQCVCSARDENEEGLAVKMGVVFHGGNNIMAVHFSLSFMGFQKGEK